MLYALDIATWDLFLGLSLLFAAPAFAAARCAAARRGILLRRFALFGGARRPRDRAAGMAMRSRWSLIVTPVVFAAVFELVRIGGGPTVDAPRASTYGVIAFVAGRGFLPRRADWRWSRGACQPGMPTTPRGAAGCGRIVRHGGTDRALAGLSGDRVSGAAILRMS